MLFTFSHAATNTTIARKKLHLYNAVINNVKIVDCFFAPYCFNMFLYTAATLFTELSQVDNGDKYVHQNIPEFLVLFV